VSMRWLGLRSASQRLGLQIVDLLLGLHRVVRSHGGDCRQGWYESLYKESPGSSLLESSGGILYRRYTCSSGLYKQVNYLCVNSPPGMNDVYKFSRRFKKEHGHNQGNVFSGTWAYLKVH